MNEVPFFSTVSIRAKSREKKNVGRWKRVYVRVPLCKDDTSQCYRLDLEKKKETKKNRQDTSNIQHIYFGFLF